MGSFDGATFKERGRNAQTWPLWGKAGIAVIKKIPGGPKNVIQKLTIDMPRLDLVVRVTAAELAALYGKVGVEGSLVFSYETCTARLERMDGEEVGAGNDRYFVTLHLLRSSGAIAGTPATALLSDSGAYLLSDGGDYLTQG